MTAPPSPTALVADDEPLLTQGLLAQLCSLWPELRVVATVGNGADARRQALALQPDVCFLDIRMPGQTGLEAAQALVDDWPAATGHKPLPLFVFVTAFDRYALEAFDARAVDYLLKPIEPERLARCVARLQDQVRLRAGADPGIVLATAVEQLRGLLVGDTAAAQKPVPLRVIPARVGATVSMVPVDSVLYFAADDKYVRIVTAEREHLIRLSLRELLPQLDSGMFWQIHRGTVVQAQRIEAVTQLDTGMLIVRMRGRSEELKVSRLYAHRFKAL